jgi:tetratricopeptide (TPR) repeat protein
MLKFTRLCGALVLLTLTVGTIACQKENIASTNSNNNAQAAPYVDRREEIRNSKKAAIAELDATIRQNPKDSEAYNQRGLLYFALGEKLLSKDDHTPEEFAADVNHLNAALADFDQVIKFQPNNAVAYNHRGLTYSTLYDRTMQIPYQESGKFRRTSEGLIDNGYYEKGAIGDFDKAIKLKPDYAEAYKNRGVAQLQLGQLPQAAADLNQAIQLKPDYADAYKARGMAFSRYGGFGGSNPNEQPRQALADLNQAIKLNPDDAEAYMNRGNLIANDRSLGDKKAIMADYNKALELHRQQGTLEPWMEQQVANLAEKLR